MPAKKELSPWAGCSVICLLWISPHLHARDCLTERKTSKKKLQFMKHWNPRVHEILSCWREFQSLRSRVKVLLFTRVELRCVGRLPAAVPPGTRLCWIWNGKESWACLKGKLFFWTCLNVDVNLSCFVISTWVSGSFSSPIVSMTNLHWPRAAFPST